MRAAVLNIDKPAGMTSFAVVRQVRQAASVKRVGHAGTLDPLATGVLPILLGGATRLSELAHKLPKAYDAEVLFGATTVTDDAEAEREFVADPSGLTAEQVRTALRAFVGRISQRPPLFSAVKIDGERSYKLARRGGEMEAPQPRMVEILEADLLEFSGGPEARARVRVVCHSGVYLRALARDLGQRLGVGGYLGRLVRTAYGPLKVEDAVSLDRLTTSEAVEAAALSPSVLLPDMRPVRLSVEQEALVRAGRPVRVLPPPPPGLLRALDAEGGLVAIGHTDPLHRTFVPDKVLA
ncbi:MAG: tRNA pseudouridine(55) synthase TruB [Candidatus Dormibacteraeota bacterium]|nr:tRNA pseudouridine(55) synthase TruB [Candidatus Dormibacteraeota bacterium]